jgi:hypothetical protein
MLAKNFSLKNLDLSHNFIQGTDCDPIYRGVVHNKNMVIVITKCWLFIRFDLLL